MLLYATKLFFIGGMWMPIAAPFSIFFLSFMATSGFVYIQEKRQRDLVMDLFSRHVSQEVANKVWEQRDNFIKNGRLKTQQATATILFTDLVGYTSTAEKMDAEALMAWLNDYMEIMATCVLKHGGMIDDFLGDAIKADFGVPITSNNEDWIRKNANAAIECALEMNDEMAKLNQNRAKSNLPAIGMRVGIATGPVIAGSLGSRERLKYTTLGDTVNIAARLESYGREISATENEYCTILLAESTKDYLDDAFRTQSIGELFLKGKEKGLLAYKLLPDKIS